MKASAKLAQRLVIKQKPLIGHVPQMHDTDLTASAPTPTRSHTHSQRLCLQVWERGPREVLRPLPLAGEDRGEGSCGMHHIQQKPPLALVFTAQTAMKKIAIQISGSAA